MKRHLPSYFAIAVVLLYGLYNAWLQERTESRKDILQIKPQSPQTLSSANIDTYIVDVINRGSSSLHFKKEERMAAGFVSPDDAPGVACYVRTLAGESCRYPKEASLLYSSNCAGCHGNDGKGLHGTYPDLTRRPLLGVEMHRKMPAAQ